MIFNVCIWLLPKWFRFTYQPSDGSAVGIRWHMCLVLEISLGSTSISIFFLYIKVGKRADGILDAR